MLDSSQVLQHSIDPKVFYRMLRAVLNDGLRDRKLDGPLTKQPGLGAQRLLTVIRVRSTSRAGGETIRIATALSIDPSPLLPLPMEERMKRLLQLMPSILMNEIFADCPRLNVSGFSWAPKSLLESGGPEGGNHWIIYHESTLGRKVEEARLTTHGLRLSLPGLDIDPSVFNTHNALSILSLSNLIPKKSWLLSWNEIIYRADIESVFHDMTLDDIGPPKYASYAFILGLWDSNASTCPAVLVAWNVDGFDEEGARIV
jgi:hypothetical protein